jgi:hypothetical protein
LIRNLSQEVNLSRLEDSLKALWFLHYSSLSRLEDLSEALWFTTWVKKWIFPDLKTHSRLSDSLLEYFKTWRLVQGPLIYAATTWVFEWTPCVQTWRLARGSLIPALLESFKTRRLVQGPLIHNLSPSRNDLSRLEDSLKALLHYSSISRLEDLPKAIWFTTWVFQPNQPIQTWRLVQGSLALLESFKTRRLIQGLHNLSPSRNESLLEDSLEVLWFLHYSSLERLEDLFKALWFTTWVPEDMNVSWLEDSLEALLHYSSLSRNESSPTWRPAKGSLFLHYSNLSRLEDLFKALWFMPPQL